MRFVLLALLVGCAAEPPAAPPVAEVPIEAPAPVDPAVTLAATVANEIAANPADAEAILAKNQLDRTKFDAMLYDIAADPVKSKAYAAARK